MAIKISKKTKVILLSVLGVLFLSGTGFLIWRVTQEETVAPEDSEAGVTCPSDCRSGDGFDCKTAGCCLDNEWYYGILPDCIKSCPCQGGTGWCTCTPVTPPPPEECKYITNVGDTGPVGSACNSSNCDGPCGIYTYKCGLRCYDASCGAEACDYSPTPCTCGYYTYDQSGDGKKSCGVSPCNEGELKWTRECEGDCSPEDYYKCTVDSLCAPEVQCTSCACSNLGNGWVTRPCDPSNPNCQSQWSTCTPSGCSQTDTIKPVMCYKDTTTYCSACTSCSDLGTGWTTTPCSGDNCLVEQTTCTPSGCTPTSTIRPINCYKQTDVVEYCTSCGSCSSLGSGWSTTPCSGAGCLTEETNCTPVGCTPTATIKPVTCYKQNQIVEYCTSCQDCEDLGTGWGDYCPSLGDCIEQQTTCSPYGCTPTGSLSPKTCYKVTYVPPVDTCGNGICDGDDTLQNCPQDCWECGDGSCTSPYENAISCPQDCTECGDGMCTDGETANNCPQDCNPICPDGYCTHDENPSSCPLDCIANCGDGYCTHFENALNCPADCEAVCGDGSCTHDETAVSCPEDCDADCGDGACTGDENALTCPNDCDAECGDGYCTHTENANTCPADCDAVCGDGYCTGDETASSCPSDCDPTCGDGACTHDENAYSCPEDCDENCGDGYCTGSENQTNCPIDCGTASGPVPQTGIFDTVISKIVAGILLILIGINWGSITRTLTRLNYTTKEKIMDRKLEKFERKVSKKK